jgi:hypothetical protein
MADRRDLIAQLARALIDLYAGLQARMAADLARRLAAGMDSPTWAEDKLAAVGTVRRWAEVLLSRLDGPMGDEVAQTVMLAYMRGGSEALAELARVQSTHADWLAAAQLTDPGPVLREMIAKRRSGLLAELGRVATHLPGAAPINRLALALVTGLRGTHLQVLRWQLDTYREVIARTSPTVLAGAETRRRAAQIAWEHLLSQGITGFVDRSGRRWELASYVEMATRTTVAQALLEGQMDRLSAAGINLMLVSNSPQECPRCRPWEGKVLTRAGVPGRHTVQAPSAVRRGATVDVEVAGTVAEAISRGLFHPNCTHSLTGYLPGATRRPTRTENPQGYEDRQQLRALERKVRRAKLLEAGAIDPAAKRDAAAKVRAAQAAIREHIRTTGLIRQPAREQIGTAR